MHSLNIRSFNRPVLVDSLINILLINLLINLKDICKTSLDRDLPYLKSILTAVLIFPRRILCKKFLLSLFLLFIARIARQLPLLLNVFYIKQIADTELCIECSTWRKREPSTPIGLASKNFV
jgi:hypothetical protein